MNAYNHEKYWNTVAKRPGLCHDESLPWPIWTHIPSLSPIDSCTIVPPHYLHEIEYHEFCQCRASRSVLLWHSKPHRDHISSSTVLKVSGKHPTTCLFPILTGELIEHLAHLTVRIQRINGIPQNADSLRMSFGEVDKKGVRNITAYVIRGARQTRVEWIAIKQGQNVVEAFGKKVGGLSDAEEQTKGQPLS